MRSRRATWILFTFVVVLGLGFAEVGLRIAVPRRAILDITEDAYWFDALREKAPLQEGTDVVHDPLLGWSNRPGYANDDVRIDEHGLRAHRANSIERRPGIERILLIGDSFTYGLGVSNKDTFAALLDERLPSAEVFNAGVNGWGTGQSYLDLRERRLAFDPDVIVVGIYEDDFLRLGVSAREFLKPRLVVRGDELVVTNAPIPHPTSVDPEQLPRFERPRIFDLARFAYQKLRWKLVGRYQSDDTFEANATVLRYVLRDLKTLARADRHREVIVLTWPSMHYEKSWDSGRIRARVSAEAKALGLPVYDLTEALKSRAATDGRPVYDPVSAHWNRAGHEVAAAQLLEHFGRVPGATASRRASAAQNAPDS